MYLHTIRVNEWLQLRLFHRNGNVTALYFLTIQINQRVIGIVINWILHLSATKYKTHTNTSLLLKIVPLLKLY